MFVATFLRNQRGASGAEFALIAPFFLLSLMAILDAGRFAWAFNRAEKATQIGARWAVATDMIPSDLASYSFALSCNVPQGTAVPLAQFDNAECQSGAAANTATCTVTAPGCSTAIGNTANQAAFEALYTRMEQMYPALGRDNIHIVYANSGLGYSGDPNGPDVAPFTTVRLNNVRFQPMTTLIFGFDIAIPEARYTLTLEDGQGAFSN